MPDAHANFAYTTVATAPAPATSGTSLVVAAGTGARFPAAPFNATIWPASAAASAANAEIVRVTNISTDTLTITRTQESTSARTVLVGDQIAATITVKTTTDIETLPVGGVLTGNLPNPGLAGAVATGAALGSDVVTLTGTQAVTGAKTLTAPHFTTAVVDSGGLAISSGVLTVASDVIARRYKATGTALVNGDFVLSAGWGSTATATAGAGSDQRGIVVVTAGGTGIAANPTITLTFKDGTWTSAPIVLCQMTGGSGLATAVAIGITPTTTAVVFQPLFTPGSGSSYNFSWIAMGGPS